MGTTYKVQVDWLNTGLFAGTYDDLPVLNNQSVGIRTGRDQPKKFAPARPGVANFRADNRDKRFSDKAGLIGSNLLPNRAVQVLAAYDEQIDNFESSWSAGTTDGSIKKEGAGSLSMTTTAGGTVQPQKTVSLDYSRLDNATTWSLWVYVDDVTKLSSLTLFFGISGALYTGPNLATGLVNGWNFVSGLRSAFVASGSPNWASIPKLQVRTVAVASQIVTVKVDDWRWSKNYTLFTGILDNWNVSIPAYPLIVADFEAVDQLAYLYETTVSTVLLTASSRTDQCITTVLNAAGWPAGLRLLDVGYTNLINYWAEGKSALTALQEIAEHEQGFIYISKDGKLVFESRYNRVDRAATINGTLTESAEIKSITFVNRIRDVVNRVTATVNPRTVAGARTDVWFQNATLYLGPNEVRTVYVLTSSDPFSGALVPVSGTDFTLTGGSVSVSALNRTAGQSCTFTLTAGASGAIVTGLKLRAFTVTAATPVVWVAEDLTSQGIYGLRPRSIDLSFLADPNVGRDAAQALVIRYKDPVDAVAVTVKASPDAGIADNAFWTAINTELSDQLSLNIPMIGVVWSGFVESKQHRISSRIHEITLTIEKAGAVVPAFTLDDAVTALLDGASTLLSW